MGTVEADAGVPWPNKKEFYQLEDSIGVGATATVFKVRGFGFLTSGICLWPLTFGLWFLILALVKMVVSRVS